MLELSSGVQQSRALVVVIVLSLITLAFFVLVAVMSRREIPKDRVAKVGYSYRTYWAAFLLVVLTIAGIWSFLGMPYSGVDSDAPRTKMTLTAMQYGFVPAPASIPTGVASIAVTSVDVNHGVGIYTPDGTLLSQVQAMPGKTNVLEVEFDKPGAYPLLCMEYCGLAHHQMIGVLTVTEAQA